MKKTYLDMNIYNRPADYFLTGDDKLLNKRHAPGLEQMILLNPIDFILQHGGQ